MIIEQLIFTIIAFSLFVVIFFKMIKHNDSTYVSVLVLQALGIAVDFVSVLYGTGLNTISRIFMWFMSFLVPLAVILMEKKNISLFENLKILTATIYFKIGNNKKAKQILLEVVDKKENSYKAHKLLAEIYELEGGTRKAIDEYVIAIDINKHDYNSYYKVAVLLNSLEKKDEATQMLTVLLSIEPNYLEATTLLGEIYISKEMYKEAVSVYQNALKYNELNFDLYYSLGIAYTMLNDFQNAKNYYKKAAEINSLSYNSIYSLAEIALIYKELDIAERKFLEAVEDENLSADAYFELSKISIIKKDRDTAIKYANIAIDLNSKKIVEKIKKDSIFIPIYAKLSIPFNLEDTENNKQNRLSKIEIKAKEHLEDMVDITRKLSYDDINLLKNIKQKQNKIENAEKEQREIED